MRSIKYQTCLQSWTRHSRIVLATLGNPYHSRFLEDAKTIEDGTGNPAPTTLFEWTQWSMSSLEMATRRSQLPTELQKAFRRTTNINRTIITICLCRVACIPKQTTIFMGIQLLQRLQQLSCTRISVLLDKDIVLADWNASS